MFRQTLLCLAALSLPASTSVAADDAARLDWRTWQRMPVFDGGRLMPLDSFARSVVQEICGRQRPRLDPAGIPQSSPARQMFPGGRPRKFDAAELLFSWVVETEKWEDVQFLGPASGQLRDELLRRSSGSRQGGRAAYVSPRELLEAGRFWQRLEELRQRQRTAQAEPGEVKFVGVDEQAVELWRAYTLYRLVTFNPASPTDARSRFFEKLTGAVHAWRDLEPQLRGQLQAALPAVEGYGMRAYPPPRGAQSDSGASIDAFAQSITGLLSLIDQDQLTIEKADPLLAAARRAAAKLEQQTAEACREARGEGRGAREEGRGEREEGREKRDEGEAHQSSIIDHPSSVRLAAKTAGLAQVADETHLALYDNGRALRLVPALNPAALKADRDLDDDSQPWLSLQALLFGSEALLAEYPQQELAGLRGAFDRVRAVYLDRDAADRPVGFAGAMDQFAAATRALGEKIEPLRGELPGPGEEQNIVDMLAATAYPPDGYTDVELFYNRLDPFFWTWLVCLVSTVCFVVSLFLARRALFWTGVVPLTLALALIVYGLTLRTEITGWVSVTNMFEVIMFVGLGAGVLGLWFSLLPLLRPGVGQAWQMTALPQALRHWLCGGRWLRRRSPSSETESRLAADGTSANRLGVAVPATAKRQGDVRFLAISNWLLLLPRAALAAGIFAALTLRPYGSGGTQTIISLRPDADLSLSLASANSLLTWAVGGCVLLLALWWLPRLMLAAVLTVAIVPASCRGGTASGLLPDVYRHRLCAVTGAAVTLLATVLGYYVPIFHKDIRALMPIIRDNFWLTVHVSSITASYGAAVLAWGLGLVALGYYLFGRYRPADARPDPTGTGRAKSEIRNPKSEISNPKPQIRNPKSEILNPKSEIPARRPPEACAVLAQSIYRAIHVAVWLLAVGTILGALWGDVAWGRFWAWDPKEVWALISLLVYLGVLHARCGGFSGDFGLVLASLLGTTSIVMAWYGVNYVLRSGLHTYAGGTGGLWYVVAVVAANWLFLALAAVRYFLETRLRAARLPGGSQGHTVANKPG
jgi:ABC-type transport system involved in cytochrome c biogenesis permease subunit